VPDITIHIVDDHQMLIDGLKALLQGEERFKIIHESNDGESALAAIENEKPTILLTDINMPGMSGIELTQKVKSKFPDVKIIALSMFGERGMISEMLQAGVNGYILKNTGKTELINALNKVAAGGMFFSDEVSVEMMKAVASPQPAQDESDAVNLTQREIEIVQLIAQEMSNAEIAEKLFISERTVETHRKNIFRKTATKSVVGLIKYAFEKKLIS
jgi:two-component system, NarL family, nitrate/nitrite response regulator NarL